ncbi:Protein MICRORCHIDIA 1 [Glycine soja]
MSLLPKTEQNDVPVVDIDSDEDGGAAVAPAKNDASSHKTPSPQVELVQQETPSSSSSLSASDGLSRSFWKAGDYVVGPSSKPAPFQGHLEHARVHPKFLHSNATSHKWAFGAIAELVDNAVDENQNGATFVKIDKLDVKKDNSPALCFLDDGGGMNPNAIRKCMSLGYSSKKSKTTIGQYGNGFKTSTMRLGADVIVFSRAMHSGYIFYIGQACVTSRATQSVGLLSYTFLRRTGQDDVVVPMIDFDISGHWAEPIIYSSQHEWSANLKTILDWSPFTSKEELMLQERAYPLEMSSGSGAWRARNPNGCLPGIGCSRNPNGFILGGKGNPIGPPKGLDSNIPPKGRAKKGSLNGSLPPKNLEIKLLGGPKEPKPPKPANESPKLKDPCHPLILAFYGRVDTRQTLHNINEDELAGSEEEWKEKGQKYLLKWTESVEASDSNGQAEQARCEGWALPSSEHIHVVGTIFEARDEVGSSCTQERIRKNSSGRAYLRPIDGPSVFVTLQADSLQREGRCWKKPPKLWSLLDRGIRGFDDIGSHGTKVVIYNLWLNDEGIYELSFDDDAEDIMLRDEATHGAEKNLCKKTVQLQSHISYRLRFSLRAYVSMLYLRKFSNFSIILRGKLVDQFNIVDDLIYSKVIPYKPQLAMASNEAIVETKTTIGFIKEAAEIKVTGFNVYHKNRLIKPFWKVVADGSSKGRCVVGVLEANFIEPAHDKQDFERSVLFIRLENKLKQMTMDYWREHCHLVGYQPPNLKSQKNVVKEAHIRKSAEHSTNPQNQLLADQQDTRLVAEHQSGLSQSVVGLAVTGMQGLRHEHLGTIVETPGSVSPDEICAENIKLFERCEEYRQKETELKQTVVDLEDELKQIQKKCTLLVSLVETKRKAKSVKGQ